MAKKYIDADLLRKEIEKRKNICNGVYERDSDTYYQGKAVAYQETLSLIDSLQQEQPCEDLEQAASEYSKRVSDGHNYRDLICGFIAGAEWQEQQMNNYTSKETAKRIARGSLGVQDFMRKIDEYKGEKE